MKKHILMVGLLFFISSFVFAAIGSDITTQTISWRSEKVTQIATGVISSEAQQLIVYKKERIEWIDSKGVKKYDLIIQSSSGSLQLNGQGELTYQVTGDKVRGNLTIKKNASQTVIMAVLVVDNRPAIYEWLVSSYTLL